MEKKYRIIAEARRKGHDIRFDVLCYSKAKDYAAVKDEIGNTKGEYIRLYNPALNT